MNVCKVDGCRALATGESYFCEPHRQAWLDSGEFLRIKAGKLDQQRRDRAMADFAQRVGKETNPAPQEGQ